MPRGSGRWPPHAQVEVRAHLTELTATTGLRCTPSAATPRQAALAASLTRLARDSGQLLILDAGPRERLYSFTEGAVLGDLAVAEHEAIGKPTASPLGCAFPADPRMEVDDDLVSLRQP